MMITIPVAFIDRILSSGLHDWFAQVCLVLTQKAFSWEDFPTS